MYFLNNFENGKYAKAFNKFFKGLYTIEKGLPTETLNYGPTGTGRRVSPQNIREYLLKKLGLKDTEQLEKDWKSFIAAIPIEGPEARVKRGLMEVNKFEFEDALEDLSTAIEAGTTDSRAFWARGHALFLTGKSKDAVKDLQKAVEMDPLSAKYRFDLSVVLVGPKAMKISGGTIESIDDESGPKIDKPEAKQQAGLALELAPDNEKYHAWFDRFR